MPKIKTKDKIKKKKKTKAELKLIRREKKLARAKELELKIKKKLTKFSANHRVYLNCFPNGVRYNNKGEVKSGNYWQHIYICKNLCDTPCDNFFEKVYLCRELDCPNYPICISKDVEERNRTCKRKGHLKDRKKLNTLYNKYLHLYQIYRGLRTAPLQTLRFLDKRKK